MKRALLIVPPTGSYLREDRCQTRTKFIPRPPMALAYAASILRQVDLEPLIIDYPAEKKGWGYFRRDVSNFKPDLLLVNVTLHTLSEDILAFEIAREINPSIITIAKGADLYLNDRAILQAVPQLDIGIRSEIDFVLQEIVLERNWESIRGITFRRKNEVIRKPDRPFLQDLDVLPFPARDLLKNHLYLRPDTRRPIGVIQTARGCPFDCVFCVVKEVSGQRVRSRSPTNIIGEIEDCIFQYGTEDFFFSADTFTLKKRWVIEICKDILERGFKINWGCNSRVDTFDREMGHWMKKSGCWVIGFGVESGAQEILNKCNKRITLEQIEASVQLCKELGIKSYLFLILGLPWETEESAWKTIEFVKRLGPDFVEYNIAFPFPGTRLAEISEEANLFVRPDVLRYDGALGSFYLSHSEIKVLLRKILRSFYLQPNYILRRIGSIRYPVQFKSLFTYGIQRLLTFFSPV